MPATTGVYPERSRRGSDHCVARRPRPRLPAWLSRRSALSHRSVHFCYRISVMPRVLLSIYLLLGSMALAQKTPSKPDADPQVGTPAANSSSAGKNAVDSSHEVAAQDSQSLVLIKSAPVTYPKAAQDANTQGYVVLKITVNENGDVETTNSISGEAQLASAAAESAKQWKFQQVVKEGKPVKASTRLVFRFAITDGKCTSGVRQATVTTPVEHNVTVPQKEMQEFLCKKVSPGPSIIPRLHGDVVMSATVGKDGTIEGLHILSSGSPVLNRPAIDAVKQWRYRPYTVSGEPVEVETTIKVSID